MMGRVLVLHLRFQYRAAIEKEKDSLTFSCGITDIIFNTVPLQIYCCGGWRLIVDDD